MRVAETAETDSIIMGQPGSKVRVGNKKSLAPISSVEQGRDSLGEEGGAHDKLIEWEHPNVQERGNGPYQCKGRQNLYSRTHPHVSYDDLF